MAKYRMEKDINDRMAGSQAVYGSKKGKIGGSKKSKAKAAPKPAKKPATTIPTKAAGKLPTNKDLTKEIAKNKNVKTQTLKSIGQGKGPSPAKKVNYKEIDYSKPMKSVVGPASPKPPKQPNYIDIDYSNIPKVAGTSNVKKKAPNKKEASYKRYLMKGLEADWDKKTGKDKGRKGPGY